ncbi:MAG: OmpH family outer membrane protein [Gemmataceae bacterium]|nr:OmpH family outer membrane protein [Gemmataceae bacterium]
MNKSIAALAGAVAIGAVGLQALAQPGKAPATNPGAAPAMTGVVPTRTAVLNINKVLKNFNKAQQLNNIISTRVNGYGQQITQMRDELGKLQAEVAKAVTQEQKDQLQKRAVEIDRKMQDLDAEARKDISAQQGTIAVGIYKDIEGVIQRVAAANGFDLVMSYPDATTDAEMYTQPNVVRKLASQAAIPLYYKAHIDITDAVVQTLNATFPVAAPPATTAQPGGTSAIIPTGGTQPQQPQSPQLPPRKQ